MTTSHPSEHLTPADRRAQCSHADLDGYAIDDTSEGHVTVVATCLDCCATVTATVDAAAFVEVGR